MSGDESLGQQGGWRVIDKQVLLAELVRSSVVGTHVVQLLDT